MNAKILVSSSHGNFHFHPKTGEVRAECIALDPEFGSMPVRVNVDELRAQEVPDILQHHLKNGLLPEYDVLDVGFWMEGGTYEPPAEDWRKERDEMNKGE